jgi:hypothetical protein
MKVAVSMTLDVDSAAWRSVFDVPQDREIREDVREYAAAAVLSAFGERGVLHDPEPEAVDEVPMVFDVNIADGESDVADGDAEADVDAVKV